MDLKVVLTPEKIVAIFCAHLDEKAEQLVLEELKRPCIEVLPNALVQIAQFITPGQELDKLLVTYAGKLIGENIDHLSNLAGCARPNSNVRLYALRRLTVLRRQSTSQKIGVAA